MDSFKQNPQICISASLHTDILKTFGKGNSSSVCVCSMVTEFQFYEIKRVLEMNGGDGGMTM